jgi:mRNA interferase MazF
VLLSAVGSNDFIACQITSNREADPDSIELAAVAFASGSLRVTSYARPGKLFTANRRIVSKRVARLTGPLQEQIKEAVIRVIRHG